eukprot:TRINITY_DN72123_c0_g1_i1.p1 TRINITY_DN72123_c0_g1~~TRINITY_DN72123_c0_g1_i1.p1  ORF type:complete len:412 (-),score=105.25 TRINITY_DN72123_c0_g1_i1:134-1369(-)
MGGGCSASKKEVATVQQQPSAEKEEVKPIDAALVREAEKTVPPLEESKPPGIGAVEPAEPPKAEAPPPEDAKACEQDVTESAVKEPPKVEDPPLEDAKQSDQVEAEDTPLEDAKDLEQAATESVAKELPTADEVIDREAKSEGPSIEELQVQHESDIAPQEAAADAPQVEKVDDVALAAANNAEVAELMKNEDIRAAVVTTVDQIWDAYDKDGSGALEADEVKEFTRATYADSSGEFKECDYANFYAEIDLDDNGKVSKDEMIAFICKMWMAAQAAAEEPAAAAEVVPEVAPDEQQGAQAAPESNQQDMVALASAQDASVAELMKNEDIRAAVVSTVDQIWETYDKDASGTLEAAEVKEFTLATYADSSAQFQESDYESFYAQIDLDGNGKVSKDEMVSFICKMWMAAPQE